jgi:hypothetical protein
MKHCLLSKAELEISQAALWYDLRSPGIGERFLEAFEAALAEVIAAPNRYAYFPGLEDLGIRYRQLRRFQYVILYKIEHDEIVVTSVSPTARLK